MDGFRCLFSFEEEKLRNDERSIGVPNLENIRGLAEKVPLSMNEGVDRRGRRA